MTPPTTQETAVLHAEFNRLTKQSVRYDMGRHFQWESWLAAGYTVEDLRLVIAYIWRRIKAGKRQRESFKLSALIGDLPKFEDDLSVARSEATIAQKEAKRPVVSPAKAAALRSSGRPSEVPARPVQGPAERKAYVATLLENLKRSVL